jgi:hypothetical protein
MVLVDVGHELLDERRGLFDRPPGQLARVVLVGLDRELVVVDLAAREAVLAVDPDRLPLAGDDALGDNVVDPSLERPSGVEGVVPVEEGEGRVRGPRVTAARVATLRDRWGSWPRTSLGSGPHPTWSPSPASTWR